MSVFTVVIELAPGWDPEDLPEGPEAFIEALIEGSPFDLVALYPDDVTAV